MGTVGGADPGGTPCMGSGYVTPQTYTTNGSPGGPQWRITAEWVTQWSHSGESLQNGFPPEKLPLR